MNSETIKTEVRQRYGRLVKEKASCCGPSSESCGATLSQDRVVRLAGYTAEELAGIAPSAVENSFGCGHPLAFAGVEWGQSVLDIGSGAGIDCFLAASRVGPEGRVIGVDMTPEMLETARAGAGRAGLENVEFRMGEAESLPVESASVDWVISNCVINLSPDKPAVFGEISRVLRAGGRFSISDIVLGKKLPPEIAQDLLAWTGCLAGAITETDYLDGLRRAGLRNVTVQDRLVYDESAILALLSGCGSPAQASLTPLASGLVGQVWSAKIYGEKE